MKVLRQILTLLAFTTIISSSAFADSHACKGDCKDKKECHCKECKCDNEKECSCDESCKAESCKDHHQEGSKK